jgi:hypothetical protein
MWCVLSFAGRWISGFESGDLDVGEGVPWGGFSINDDFVV